MVTFKSISIMLSVAVFFANCTTSNSDSRIIGGRDVVLTSAMARELDSVMLTFNFYPERWNLTGDTLWVVNSRDSMFLVGYNIDLQRDFCHWGTIGNGPGEYISPGIVEGHVDNGFVLYGNTENKVVSYLSHGEGVIPIRRGKMPQWLCDRGLPKPYTRMSAVDDSVYIGTYFLPRQAGADILNWHTGELLDEIHLSVEQPEEHMSGPYEFKIASYGDNIVVAYRYINRVELYKLGADRTAELQCVIGDGVNQNDLFEADRDDEMIKYYSDVQCDSTHIYLLFHGVAEKDLGNSPTYLRVYDHKLNENQRNFLYDRYFDRFLVTQKGQILLYSPIDEDYLFTSMVD